MDGSQNAARVAIELILSLGIANLFDGITGYGLQVDINLAAHLAHDDHLACGDKTLASHASLVIIGQELVKNSIGNLIGHLVGMALRYRF